MAAMASYQQGFLVNILSSNRKPHGRLPRHGNLISCRHPSGDDDDNSIWSSRNEKNQLSKVAMVALAAGVLTFGSVGDAFAAKSGGRIGGQAFRSSAPKASAPRSNSRTNIYINPPVAPPLVGGYGYGYGVPFYGGWGWSPFSFFAPGPSVAVGVGGGFDSLVLFMLLGAIAAVIRRFAGSRSEDDDY